MLIKNKLVNICKNTVLLCLLVEHKFAKQFPFLFVTNQAQYSKIYVEIPCAWASRCLVKKIQPRLFIEKTQNKSTTPWWLNTMVKHPMATFLIFSAQIQIKQIPDAWATSKPIGTSQNFMVGSREFTSTGWGSHPPTHYRPRWASATAIRNPSNLLSWCVVNPEPTIPVANQLDASSPLVEVYSRSWNLWKFHARILTLPLPQTTTYKQH